MPGGESPSALRSGRDGIARGRFTSRYSSGLSGSTVSKGRAPEDIDSVIRVAYASVGFGSHLR